jgi:hypothetical protein
LLVLTAFAFFGGATLQAMPVENRQGSHTMQVGIPCDQMAGMMQSPKPGTEMPCKDIMPDCIKQMGCIGFPNLPTTHQLSTPVTYAVVRYHPLQQSVQGVSPEPDLFPPIAI